MTVEFACVAQRDGIQFSGMSQNEVSKAASLLGKKGRELRLRRLAAMTPEARSEKMRRVALARYNKGASQAEGVAGVRTKDVLRPKVTAQAG